jgi:hypothetical protein
MSRPRLAVLWSTAQTQCSHSTCFLSRPRMFRSRLIPMWSLHLSLVLGFIVACDSATDPFAEPDAQPIVFFRLDEAVGWELARVGPQSGMVEHIDLPMTETLFPSLSPNGAQLAFVVESEPAGVYVANANGTNARRVFDQWTDRIAWSPDATRLAVTSGGEIIIVPLSGGAPYSITNDVAVYAGHHSWSTSGRIAFSSFNTFGTSDIYTMAADGSDLRLIVRGEGSEARDPVWSPDGSHIAFADGWYGASAIYTVDASGGNRQRVTPAPPAGFGWTELGPEWSPSGEWIAFQREHTVCIGASCDHRYDIFVVPSDSGNPRNLTMGRGWGGVRPTW